MARVCGADAVCDCAQGDEEVCWDGVLGQCVRACGAGEVPGVADCLHLCLCLCLCWLSPQAILNVFREDPEFATHEAQYKAIARELLGDESDEEGGDEDGASRGGGSAWRSGRRKKHVATTTATCSWSHELCML